MAQLRGMAWFHDEVQDEFGVDLHAMVGAARATANFKIAVTWWRTQPSSGPLSGAIC